jgi:hypothetical protein
LFIYRGKVFHHSLNARYSGFNNNQLNLTVILASKSATKTTIVITTSISVITMGKGGGEMNDPNKIHDDTVEIPETAHQISSGEYFSFHFILFIYFSFSFILKVIFFILFFFNLIFERRYLSLSFSFCEGTEITRTHAHAELQNVFQSRKKKYMNFQNYPFVFTYLYASDLSLYLYLHSFSILTFPHIYKASLFF